MGGARSATMSRRGSTDSMMSRSSYARTKSSLAPVQEKTGGEFSLNLRKSRTQFIAHEGPDSYHYSPRDRRQTTPRGGAAPRAQMAASRSPQGASPSPDEGVNAEMQKELNALRGLSAGLNEEHEELQARLSDVMLENTKLKHVNAGLEEAMEAMKVRNADQSIKLSQIAPRLDGFRAEREKYQMQIADLKLQVNKLTRGMDSTAKAKQELADLKHSVTTNPETIGRVNTLQKTNNELNQQNNMLMDEIVELKKDLVSTKQKLKPVLQRLPTFSASEAHYVVPPTGASRDGQAVPLRNFGPGSEGQRTIGLTGPALGGAGASSLQSLMEDPLNKFAPPSVSGVKACPRLSHSSSQSPKQDEATKEHETTAATTTAPAPWFNRAARKQPTSVDITPSQVSEPDLDDDDEQTMNYARKLAAEAASGAYGQPAVKNNNLPAWFDHQSTDLSKNISGSATPPPAHKGASAGVKPYRASKAVIYAAYDLADPEMAEIVPRLDVSIEVDKIVAKDPTVQALAHKITAFDAILLEKDEYEELVNEWLYETQDNRD